MLLTSCGPVLNPYNEDFKCRARDDAGELYRYADGLQKSSVSRDKSDRKTEFQNGVKQEIQDNRYAVLAQLLQEEKKPLLQPPKILRVLLLPYKGEGEELFMSRYVYVKIEDSKWILTDLAEQ